GRCRRTTGPRRSGGRPGRGRRWNRTSGSRSGSWSALGSTSGAGGATPNKLTIVPFRKRGAVPDVPPLVGWEAPRMTGTSGEFAFIDWLRRRTPAAGRVLIGPGDDAAAVAWPPGPPRRVTTDMPLEGI